MSPKKTSNQEKTPQENTPLDKRDEDTPKDTRQGAVDGQCDTADVEIVDEAAAADEAEGSAVEAEREKYLRLYAEYENFRRRSRAERETLRDETRAEVIARLLPVYDNLARALETPCSDEAFLKGVELTAAQLDEILKSLGVEPIPAAGEKFDPERHNAVSSIAAEDVPENTVISEFQRGFMLSGRVIRHAVVQVSAGG